MKHNFALFIAMAFAICVLLPTGLTQDFECDPSIFKTLTDGRCHNLDEPFAGLAPSDLIRIGEVARYADGVGALDNINRPNPRFVSNIVGEDDGDYLNTRSKSRLIIFFGQFVDHDLTFVLQQEGDDAEFANILVPRDDRHFRDEIEFRRSVFFIDNGQRQYRTENTPWLDLGPVYGDSLLRTSLLRDDRDGLLRVLIVSDREFPPLRDSNDRRERGRSLCGDDRCEENLMLFSIHVLFLREHNRLARLIRSYRPNASNDEIFHRARLLNIIQYQSIVWDAYLPYILGKRSFEDITGEFRPGGGGGGRNRRNRRRNGFPDLTVFFATAAYRYGHSGVSNDLRFTDLEGRRIRSTLDLKDSFGQRGDRVIEIVRSRDRDHLPAIFAGQAILLHPKLDTKIVDGLRHELLAKAPERRDLLALNIQRGRDHGLQSLNFYREELGLEPFECDGTVRCFRELTGENDFAQILFNLYYDIELGDPWVLGMAEAPRIYKDSQLGDTFTLVIAQQFNLIRNADRIWYENILEEFEEEFEENEFERLGIRFPARLADVIKNNLARDLRGLDELESAFVIDPVYITLLAGTKYQIEWILPDRLRGQEIDRFDIIIRFNDGRELTTDLEDVDADQYYFFEEDALPNTRYFIVVNAVLANRAVVTIGDIEFVTLDESADLEPLNVTSLTVGQSVGIGAAVVAGVGIFAFIVYSVIAKRSKDAELRTELV